MQYPLFCAKPAAKDATNYALQRTETDASFSGDGPQTQADTVVQHNPE